MKIIADENIPYLAECFSSIGDIEILNGRKIAKKNVKNADILLVRSVTSVGKNLLEGTKVRFVGSATSGFEHIDTGFLARNNIGFAYAPASNANSVAEYVIAALLEVGQKQTIALDGKSIGIIGVGNIGSRVEKKCRALGMKLFLNDPPLFRQTGDEKYLPLEKLFCCDFIAIHTPLTFEGIDKTYHLANESFLGSLKQGCVFINTARGFVVDSEALKNATKGGKIKASILDVWENEPDIDIELLRMVDIGTAHIAGYSLDGKVAGTTMIYKAVCDYFRLPKEKTLSDFLPEPLVPAIAVNGDTDEQKTLHHIVTQIYDISTDDLSLRNLLNVPDDKRAAYFDRLRKEYPVRREFKNTRVSAKNAEKSLVEKLKGIGFTVEKDEQ